MMRPKSRSFVVSEVMAVESPYLPDIEACLRETHPDYEPYFRTVVRDLRHADGRHEAQVFAATRDGRALGFGQVFYREWNHGVIAWLDVLGVVGGCRRQGIGTALVKEIVSATRKVSSQRRLPAVGVLSLIDPGNTPVVRLHQRLGGQFRDDLSYRTSPDLESETDVLVWYPLADDYANVPTVALAWQAWQFGGLPRDEFVNRYGEVADVEPPDGSAAATPSEGVGNETK